MPKKVQDVLAMLRREGWVLIGQKGSHRQFRHPGKPGKVTVAGRPSKDLAPDTYQSILRQTGLKE